MNTPSSTPRSRRSERVRDRRVTTAATDRPSKSDIQVASTAMRKEFTIASVTGTSRACGSRRLEGLVVGEGSTRRRPGGGDHETRSYDHQEEEPPSPQGREVAASVAGPGTGRPWVRRTPRASGRDQEDRDHEELEHRQGGGGLQVEQVRGEQVDLVRRGVAHSSERQHDPEGGGTEENDRGRRHDRGSEGRQGDVAEHLPRRRPERRGGLAVWSRDSRAPPTTRMATDALKKTRPA
jgi:hypothetical protein